jgi:CheY-like chemotaxis protein
MAHPTRFEHVACLISELGVLSSDNISVADVLVREDAAEWFRQRGWRVLETAIGAGALQMLREVHSVHLLFTDINLADAITGWDVADAGRAAHPDLAVIYASGGPEDHARCVPRGIFCPSLCRPEISCQPVRGLCRLPDKSPRTDRIVRLKRIYKQTTCPSRPDPWYCRSWCR